jgi:DNA-binding MarR family transcriptional regulator
MQLGDLAARTSLTVSGITRIVDRLAAEGLVERVRAGDDARICFAVLTDAGFERLRRAYPVHLAGVRRHVIDRLGDLEFEKLAAAFATFAE